MRLIAAWVALLAWGQAEKPSPSPPPDESELLPSYSVRMYAARSDKVWAAVQQLLPELDLAADKTATADQFMVTKWRNFRSAKRPDLAVFATPSGLDSDRFQLHVFVSPFAEPARVHLGSVVEFRTPASRGGPVQTSVAYSSGPVEDWFFVQLEGKLGEQGRRVPKAREPRRALARSLLGDPPDPCLAAPVPTGEGLKVVPKGDITPPEKIKDSFVEIVYPPAQSEARHQATIPVLFTIGEDGAVYGERVVGEPPAREFQVAVLGALSLARYRPTRVKGCPVETITTYTVNYRLR